MEAKTESESQDGKEVRQATALQIELWGGDCKIASNQYGTL